MQENLTDAAFEFSDRLKAAREAGHYTDDLTATLGRVLIADVISPTDVLGALSIATDLIQHLENELSGNEDQGYAVKRAFELVSKAITILELETGVYSGQFLGFDHSLSSLSSKNLSDI